MNDRLKEKLEILSDAAKYDVSCASSGSKRGNPKGKLGHTTGMGICHTYTADGRCVSLLKILLTNHCIYDCAYCVSRKSNDVKRAAFTVEEVVKLTINFYRRNYIEGLFLSSGIFKNADFTMERLVRIAKELRLQHNFNGYIHLKAIPGSSPELLKEAGTYADRLSVNLELPSEQSLKRIAPEKNYAEVLQPMSYLKEQIQEYKVEKKRYKSITPFSPAGQSTQLVIGASPESDGQILQLSNRLYSDQKLKRVYYSAFVPVSTDARLPALQKPPVLREHRLYQADWLMRFYHFKADELVENSQDNLSLEMDPKLAWALRHPEFFPINPQTAPYRSLIRVPGLGTKTAKLILNARKFGKIREEHLRRMGLAWNRAKYFLDLNQAQHLQWLKSGLQPQQLQLPTSTTQPQQLQLFS